MKTVLAALTRRPIEPGDEEFLAHLYASTRAEEMALVPWSEAQKATFLQQQFHAQHTFYRAQFPDARYDLLLIAGEPAGRLYVDRRPEEFCILDIALLPEHQGQGIGTALLQEIMEEATVEGKPIRLHVEPTNPARRLYTRLGFTPIRENGPYIQMECLPGRTAG
jgi:ribosomal protein S18 acetylase RimI-like enzyme